MLDLLWHFKNQFFHIILLSISWTYSISGGFPMNLSFYDVFEWHSRILQRNFLLGLSFELLQNQGFAMKADKSISSTMINFILKVWMYSSLHLQNRIPLSYHGYILWIVLMTIIILLYQIVCKFLHYHQIGLMESPKLMICQVFTIFLT